MISVSCWMLFAMEILRISNERFYTALALPTKTVYGMPLSGLDLKFLLRIEMQGIRKSALIQALIRKC